MQQYRERVKLEGGGGRDRVSDSELASLASLSMKTDSFMCFSEKAKMDIQNILKENPDRNFIDRYFFLYFLILLLSLLFV